MPLGSPTRVPTPGGVLLFDPLTTDEGGLLPSSYNLITEHGLMVNRPGLTSLGTLTAPDVALGAYWERLHADNAPVLLVGASSKLYRYNPTTRVFDALTGPVLAGTVACPVTFTYFEQGGFQYLIAVNGVDAAVENRLDQATYAAVTAGYIARSVCTVADRAFYANLTIAGGRFPSMVAWSQAGDRTVNPALNRKNLIDSGDPIIAVRRGLRKSVNIYRERSIWIASAVRATDATAFDWEEAEQVAGPLGPMAIGGDQGFRQWWLGWDLNLYSFDGTNADLLTPLQGILKGRFNPLAAALTNVVYDEMRQHLVISVALDGDTVPTHHFRYSLETKGVYPLRWNRLYPVTMLATWQVELDTPTCQLPDVPTCELPDVPTCQLGFTPGQATVIVGSHALVATHDGSADLAEEIPWQADVLMPTVPGGEYEFDGVELMAPPSCPPVRVGVSVGHTFDTRTRLELGVIDPSIAPPAYPSPLDDTAAGPNLARVTSDQDMRGRSTVVHLDGQTALPVAMRRLEIGLYTRRRMV